MRTIIRMMLLGVLIALPAAAQQQQPAYPDQVNVPPQINERFKGTLAFKAADRAVQARVSMNQWQVANDETVEIPHEGLLIIHLRAGALTVIIDGRESKLNENTIFSVQPGKRLSIRTDRDSVVLHIVEIASQ